MYCPGLLQAAEPRKPVVHVRTTGTHRDARTRRKQRHVVVTKATLIYERCSVSRAGRRASDNVEPGTIFVSPMAKLSSSFHVSFFRRDASFQIHPRSSETGNSWNSGSWSPSDDERTSWWLKRVILFHRVLHFFPLNWNFFYRGEGCWGISSFLWNFFSFFFFTEEMVGILQVILTVNFDFLWK